MITSPLHITLLQSALHWESAIANLAMLEEKIAQIENETDIIVLPEMFSTGFSMQPQQFAETMDGPTVAWMRTMSQKKRIILAGSVMIAEGDLFFNRFIWMQPNGVYYHYDKRHLFAYAGEDKHYTAGEKRVVVSVKGWKILLQVCYDLRFPVWARQSAGDEPEYDVILYVANWPERRSLAWKTLLQARAIENQCYVVGVNRVGEDGNGIAHSGDSRIIDPMGQILFEHSQSQIMYSHYLDEKLLQETRQKLPFLKDADTFQLLNFSA